MDKISTKKQWKALGRLYFVGDMITLAFIVFYWFAIEPKHTYVIVGCTFFLLIGVYGAMNASRQMKSAPDE